MTLTLIQGHSGLAKANNQHLIISTTKQAISIKLSTMVGHFWRDLDFENVYMAWPSCLNIIYLTAVFLSTLYIYIINIFSHDWVYPLFLLLKFCWALHHIGDYEWIINDYIIMWIWNRQTHRLTDIQSHEHTHTHTHTHRCTFPDSNFDFYF